MADIEGLTKLPVAYIYVLCVSLTHQLQPFAKHDVSIFGNYSYL